MLYTVGSRVLVGTLAGTVARIEGDEIWVTPDKDFPGSRDNTFPYNRSLIEPLRKYIRCCEEFARGFEEAGVLNKDQEPTSPIEHGLVLHFPGTTVVMNNCPFCGAKITVNR